MELKKKYEDEVALKEQVLSESMKNIQKALNQIDTLENEMNTLLKDYLTSVNSIQAKLDHERSSVQEEIEKLGTCPAPRAIYREVEKKEKRFIFFTKAWKEIEQEGYDYSKCEEWKEQKAQLDKKYNDMLNKIYDEMKWKASELKEILALQRQLVELLRVKKVMPIDEEAESEMSEAVKTEKASQDVETVETIETSEDEMDIAELETVE
ncbi:MAG: hypothetical protein ACI4C1_03895 [Lachnospiraceae bacterium]